MLIWSNMLRSVISLFLWKKRTVQRRLFDVHKLTTGLKSTPKAKDKLCWTNQVMPVSIQYQYVGADTTYCCWSIQAAVL
jgi:hypothetical protein